MDKTNARCADFVISRVFRSRSGYGLFVCTCGGENKIYPDLTADYEKICKFSDAINKSEVSSVHIDELIEDFLE